MYIFLAFLCVVFGIIVMIVSKSAYLKMVWCFMLGVNLYTIGLWYFPSEPLKKHWSEMEQNDKIVGVEQPNGKISKRISLKFVVDNDTFQMRK